MTRTVFVELGFVTLHQKRPSDYAVALDVNGVATYAEKYMLVVGNGDPGDVRPEYDTFDYAEFAIKKVHLVKPEDFYTMITWQGELGSEERSKYIYAYLPDDTDFEDEHEPIKSVFEQKNGFTNFILPPIIEDRTSLIEEFISLSAAMIKRAGVNYAINVTESYSETFFDFIHVIDKTASVQDALNDIHKKTFETIELLMDDSGLSSGEIDKLVGDTVWRAQEIASDAVMDLLINDFSFSERYRDELSETRPGHVPSPTEIIKAARVIVDQILGTAFAISGNWNSGSSSELEIAYGPFHATHGYEGRVGQDRSLTIYGSAQDDRFVQQAWGESSVYVGFGNDTVTASSTTFEEYADGDDNLFHGGAGDDFLQSGDGNDTLIGGLGADRMEGGSHDDVYYVNDVGDRVTERAGKGVDTVNSSVNFVLGSQHLENLRLTGTTAVEGRGNGLSNQIVGNAANNVLDGLAGSDIAAGGKGDDIYYVDSLKDRIIERLDEGFDIVGAKASFKLGEGVHVEDLRTAYAAQTQAIDLTGNSFGNLITGNAGKNKLTGGAGADTLRGLDGDDAYYVDDKRDMVVEKDGLGADSLYAAVSYALAEDASVEYLFALDSMETNGLDLTGSKSANGLSGDMGSNRLDGRGGADTMIGWGGNDFYIVENSLDEVWEQANGGNDIVAARGDYTLAADQHVENLRTVSARATDAIDLCGNEFDNDIIGNAGANILWGRFGLDTLTGGGGADIFVFDRALGPGQVDIITDFVHLIDKVRLDDAVFPGLAKGVLSSGAFRTGTSAADASDRIVYDKRTGELLFDRDGSGSASAIVFAVLAGAPVVTASDIVVV